MTGRTDYKSGGRMNRFRLAAWMAMLAVAATSFAPFFRIRGAGPDFFLLFVVVLSLRGRRDKVINAAWAIGLAKDIMSEGRLGLHAAIFLVVAIGLLSVRSYMAVEMLRVQFWLGAMAGLAVNLLYIVLTFLYNPQMGVVESLGRVAAAMVMTALLTPVFAFFAGGCAESLNIAEQRRRAYI